MSPASEDFRPERDARIDQAIAEYLQARGAGNPISVRAWIEAHGDLASDLRSFLSDEAGLRVAREHIGDTLKDLEVQVPARIGPLELREEIGRGGMGVVYQAWDSRLCRNVAVKVLLRGTFASAEEKARFEREARIAASLEHHHIVPVLETGCVDGLVYYSMRLIQGRNLALASRSLPLDERQAAALVERVSTALEHAHSRGVLHRDLKPANILVDENGLPHVTDFGLSCNASEKGDLTRSGGMLGTLLYMSPEQASGRVKSLTASADIYALGAILYELLSGRPPFSGESDAQVLEQVLYRDPSVPVRPGCDISRDLQTICLKCLEKEPARRYPTAAALSDDLRRFLNGVPVAARPAGTLLRVSKWARRKPAAALLSFISVLSAVLAIAGTIFHIRVLEQKTAELEWNIYGMRLRQVCELSKVDRLHNCEPLLAPYARGRALEALRGPEWGYLHGLSRHELATLPIGGGAFAGGFMWDSDSICVSVPGKVQVWDGGTARLRTVYENKLSWMPKSYVSPDEKVQVLMGGHPHVFVLGKDYGITLPGVQGVPGDASFAVAEGFSIMALMWSERTRLWCVPPEHEKFVDCLAPSGTSFVRIALSHSGRLLAAGCLDGRILVLETEHYKVVAELRGHAASVSGLAFDSTEQLLVSAAGDDALKLWDLKAPGAIESLAVDGVQCVAGSARGSLIAASGRDGVARLYSVVGTEGRPSLRPVWKYRGHQEGIVALSFSRDGEKLLSISSDGTARVWSISRPGASEAVCSVPDMAWCVAFRDSGKVLISAGEDFVVRAWDVEAGRSRGELTLLDSLAFQKVPHARGCLSQDGARVVCTDKDVKNAAVWRLSMNGGRLERQEELRLPEQPIGIAGLFFSPDSRWLFCFTGLVTGDGEAVATVWEAVSESGNVRWREVSRRLVAATVRDLAVSSGLRIAARTGDQGVELWNFVTGELSVGAAGGDSLSGLAFSADGRYLAVGGNAHRVHVFRVSVVPRLSLELLCTLSGHTDKVTCLRFSADGRRLFTGSDDGTIRVWSFLESSGLFQGMECVALPGGGGQVKCMDFSPGYTVFAAGGGVLGSRGTAKVFYADSH